MENDNRITALNNIKEKKEKKAEQKRAEIIDNHNVLLGFRPLIKDFLKVYEEYCKLENIKEGEYCFYKAIEKIQVSSGGISIGTIWHKQTISVGQENIIYNIAKEHDNTMCNYKTTNINELLDNISDNVYGILSDLQIELIVSIEDYINEKYKEIDDYIKMEREENNGNK